MPLADIFSYVMPILARSDDPGQQQQQQQQLGGFAQQGGYRPQHTFNM